MIWNPATLSRVRFSHDVVVGGMGWLCPDTMSCTAVMMLPMPSVAMKELTRRRTMTKPLMTPITTQAAMATAMAGHMPHPWPVCSHTQMMVEKLIVAPTERS